ncbi:MAG: CHAD domain-containing protein [Proteobacteria bacterium]|nr:CHAD domain-containing protein [Pseudomonadota bacterium]
MPSEIELCFGLTGPSALTPRGLARWELLSDAKPRVQTLSAIYFDTPDFTLASHRFGLRVRRESGRWVQTFKAEKDGLARTEINHILSQRNLQPTPGIDASGLPDRSQLMALGMKKTDAARIARPQALRPIFSVRVRRTSWLVTVGASQIEVAFDSGIISTDAAQSEILEVELELVCGQRSDLFAATQSLSLFFEAQDQAACLEPRSKAQRGLMLIAPTAQHHRMPKARQAGSTGLVLGAHLLRAAQALAAQVWVILESAHPEGPHQARVALRQIRTILKLIHAATQNPSTDAPMDLAMDAPGDPLLLAAALADALGELRDLDVAIEKVLRPLRETLPTDQDILEASSLISTARSATQEELRHDLVRAQTRGLVIALLIRADELRTHNGLSPAAAFARGQAQLLLKRVARRKRVAHSPEGRHRLRLAYKALRYATPVLLQLGAEPSLAIAAKKAAKAQERLGDEQDKAVMLQTLRRHLSETQTAQPSGPGRFLILVEGFLIGLP